ncbi:MAG: hypothetical protein JWR19_338 [Pedosphaera sp.]|nr:hypothetical protein [Pedosphaera sp.]
MKNFLLGIIIGVLICGAVIWYYADQRHDPTAQAAKERIQSTANEGKDLAHDKFASWDLNSTNIMDELHRTGRVIRQKTQAAGSAIADATADARTTTAIKAKLVTDPDLSARSISVNTTNGRVTLSGTVSSPEDISKAMKLALDTDGVQEVVSTLQVQ